MTCNLLSTKDPSESVVVTFDYSLALDTDEQLASVESITVTTSMGTDPDPQSILQGTSLITVSGLAVQLPVTGGLDGVNYNIKVIAQTSNPQKVLALTAILPVRTM